MDEKVIISTSFPLKICLIHLITWQSLPSLHVK